MWLREVVNKQRFCVPPAGRQRRRGRCGARQETTRTCTGIVRSRLDTSLIQPGTPVPVTARTISSESVICWAIRSASDATTIMAARSGWSRHRAHIRCQPWTVRRSHAGRSSRLPVDRGLGRRPAPGRAGATRRPAPPAGTLQVKEAGAFRVELTRSSGWFGANEWVRSDLTTKQAIVAYYGGHLRALAARTRSPMSGAAAYGR